MWQDWDTDAHSKKNLLHGSFIWVQKKKGAPHSKWLRKGDISPSHSLFSPEIRSQARTQKNSWRARCVCSGRVTQWQTRTPRPAFGCSPHKPKGVKRVTETGLQPGDDAIKRNNKVSAFFSLLFPRAFALHLHGCSCMLAGTHRPTCRHSLLWIPLVPALNMRVSPMSSMHMLWGMNTGGRNGDSSVKVSRLCQDQHDWKVRIGRLFQVKAVR